MPRILLLLLLFFHPISFAETCQIRCNRLAIQGSIATGGNLGIGITSYTEMTEIGFNVSGLIINTSNDTKLFVPVIFAGLRKPICDNTYFAFGIDLLSKFGRDNGDSIKRDIFIGPYISLEYLLSSNLLLVGWINPYAYEYEKLSSHTVTTHRFFAAGGIGFNYFFT